MRDIAFVASYFNPCGYRKLRDNLDRFRSQFHDQRLLIVECAFDGKPHEIEGALHLRSPSVCFQKERLFNIGSQRLIKEGYKKIVFCDADIIFTSPEWPTVLSSDLDRCKVIQGFSKAQMHFAGTVKPGWSAMRHFLEIDRQTMTMHRGLLWGVRAEVLEQVELYDRCLVGSGDSALCLATIKGTAKPKHWDAMLVRASFAANPQLESHYREWAERWSAVVGTSIGYSPLLIESLPHGTIHNRHYVKRYDLMKAISPDDIFAADGQPLEWCCHKPDQIAAIRQYFVDREEDYEPPPET